MYSLLSNYTTKNGVIIETKPYINHMKLWSVNDFLDILSIKCANCSASSVPTSWSRGHLDLWSLTMLTSQESWPGWSSPREVFTVRRPLFAQFHYCLVWERSCFWRRTVMRKAFWSRGGAPQSVRDGHNVYGNEPLFQWRPAWRRRRQGLL